MSEERFLSRWARMKARSRGAAKPALATGGGEPAPAASVEVSPDPTPEALTAESPAAVPDTVEPASESVEPIDEATVLADWPDDLPHPDDLNADSDFSPFLSPDVSEAVRTLALRRLWRANPLLANLDGLLDYGEDFTDAGTVIAGMKSAYQAGRGYARDEPEEPDATETEAGAADSEVADADAAAETEDEETAEETAADPAEGVDDTDPDTEEEALT